MEQVAIYIVVTAFGIFVCLFVWDLFGKFCSVYEKSTQTNDDECTGAKSQWIYQCYAYAEKMHSFTLPLATKTAKKVNLKSHFNENIQFQCVYVVYVVCSVYGTCYNIKIENWPKGISTIHIHTYAYHNIQTHAPHRAKRSCTPTHRYLSLLVKWPDEWEWREEENKIQIERTHKHA